MNAPDRDPVAMAGDDAELIAAEQKLAEVYQRRAALPDDADVAWEALADEVDRLHEFISRTPPTTMAGCAVKMRLLCHPKQGPFGERDVLYEHAEAADQIREFLDKRVEAPSMSPHARDPFALAGTDPLIALVASRDSIEGSMRAIDSTLPEDEYNAALAVFYDPIKKAEDQIGEAVPTSIAGAVALLRFLLNWQEEWQDQEYSDKITANLLAGLERLDAEGAR